MKRGIIDFAADECCQTCGWFNPYDAKDGAPGECWRFPPTGVEIRENGDYDSTRTVIYRPKAHYCGEYTSFKYDDK